MASLVSIDQPEFVFVVVVDEMHEVSKKLISRFREDLPFLHFDKDCIQLRFERVWLFSSNRVITQFSSEDIANYTTEWLK